MKNKNKLLAMLFFLVFGRITAQNIQLLMSPKPSPYISDWQSRTETAKLLITNSSGKDIQVKIKTEISDGRSVVVANTDASKMPVIVIPPGVSTYDPEDVFPLNAVQYHGNLEKTTINTGRIPDDNYRICVALTDPKSGAVVGTSGTVCKTFIIEAFQAPVLINPANNQVISIADVKGIMFRWTPVLPTAQGVKYYLNVFEILQGQTRSVAIRTNKPILEKDYPGSVLQTQWPPEFALPEEGKKYVWTITPKDAEGRNLVDGVGFAEPFEFEVQPLTISNPSVHDSTFCHGTYMGQTAYAMHLIIDNNSMFNITSWSVSSSNATLLPTSTVTGSPASINAMTTGIAAQAIMFVNPTANPIYIQITFNYSGGGYYTMDYVVNVPNCNSSCCGSNAFQAIKWGTTVYDCGSNIPGSNPAGSTKSVTFIGNCTGSCVPVVKYGIYTTGGTLLTPITTAAVSTPVNISMPNVNGNYCLQAQIFCQGQLCDSCKTCFRVDSMNIDCCKAGYWMQKKFGSQQITSCPGELSNTVNCGALKALTFQYACNSEGNCAGTIEFVMRKTATNAFVMSMSAPNDGLPHMAPMPIAAGNYYLVAYAKCGVKICDSCRIYFKVACVDCCKNGYWGNKIFAGYTVNCNTSLSNVLPVASQQKTNFTYNCNPAITNQCNAIIKYKIETENGVQIGSAVYGASGQMVILNMPNVAGMYCLKVFAYCNDSTIPCDSCRVCFKLSCVNCDNLNHTAIPTLNGFDVNGSFGNTVSISRITAELVNVYVNKTPGNTGAGPIPNFEFVSGSTIGALPVTMQFSLSGNRSNIVESKVFPPSGIVNYALKIRPDATFTIKYYRIKFIIFFVNGTYCEKEITKQF